MKKSKKILALLLASILCFSSFEVFAADASEVTPTEDFSYEAMIEAYLAGNQMEDWVVEGRKEIAQELGLSEYLDERSFLSVEYRNEQKIGRDGAITDEKLDLLVEMATQDEMDAILMKSMIQTFATTRAITSGQSVGVTQQARVSGAGNGYYTVSGAYSYGYCAQNSLDFWSNGGTKYGAAYEWNDATVRKVLYYGPGGPGYSGPYYGSLGADMDYTTYAVGKLNGDCNNNTKATAYINRVSGYTDPLASGYRAYKADIASPYQDVAFLAYAPVKGTLKVVKTSSEAIAGNATDYYSLAGAVYGVYSNAACTVKVGTLTTNASGVSGTISLDAGTYYVKEITAPKGHELNTKVYTAVVSAGGACTVNATDLPLGTFILRKYSTNPELTENNDCYSLEGAEYTIYYDYECTKPIQTIITGSDGKTSHIYLTEGTYYVKETKAPKGFALDNNVYPITVTYGNVSCLDVSDIPQMDPVGILLGKIDAETNSNKPSNSLSLQGAQFTIKYYGVSLEDATRDPARDRYEPVRTWVLETDEEGYCFLSDEFLVSGDELYFNSSGDPSLPVGTITIQETKAPDGYWMNEEVFVRQILPEGTAEWVETYNMPIIPEESLDIEIYKRTWNNEDSLYYTEFTHVKPDGTSEVLEITDEFGCVEIKGLTRGIHIIYESKAPGGFKPNPQQIQLYVDDYSRVTILNKDELGESITFDGEEIGHIRYIEFWDEMYPLKVKINKRNQKGKLLDGAEFTLYDEEGNILETKETEDGILIFENIEMDKIYYLGETKAPDGYELPVGGKNSEPYVYEISFFLDAGELVASIRCPNNPLWDDIEYGYMFLVPGDSQKIVSFDVENEKNTLSFDIVNGVGDVFHLPQTGSPWTMTLISLGVILFLSGMYMRIYTQKEKIKSKKEKKARKNIMKHKFFKKAAALCMAAVVVVTGMTGLTVNAETKSAENGVADFERGEAQITINGNKDQTLAGKTFHVYKLFDAENSANLESINYTFNEDYKEVLQEVVGSKMNKDTADVTEYEVLDYIQCLNHNVAEGAQAEQTNEGSYSDFRYFIEELRNAIEEAGITGDVVTVTSASEENTVTIEGLEYGYYIVDEVTPVTGTNQAASLCIVNTANPNATVTVKSDYPTVVKKIEEDDNHISWNDIGDYEIGQTVPYKYESNVPNMNGYATYYYAWHDVMDEALTFDKDSVQVKIVDETNGNTYALTSAEYKVTENPGNGDTFVVEIGDLKAIVDREFDQKNALNENVYGQKVIVTYEATLNDKAAKDMGRAGFENDVRLEFSNNPDSNGTGQTGFTPWDTVVCFTYQLDVLKTNNHDLQLEDAKFRLYSDAECENEVYVKATEDGYNVMNRDSVGYEEPENAVEMVSDANGSVVINGLDSGTYYLKETKAPTGYRKMKDAIILTVEPTFTEERDSYVKGDGETEKTLVSLAASAHVKTFLNGVYSEEDTTLVTEAETGKINITVINTVGSKLPVTGSVATIIMLAAGAGLVMFYLSGKKKDKQEEA